MWRVGYRLNKKWYYEHIKGNAESLVAELNRLLEIGAEKFSIEKVKEK